MKVAVYGNFKEEKPIAHFIELRDFFRKNHIDFYVTQTASKHLKKHLQEDFEVFKMLDESYDFFVAIGGDGTVLKSVLLIGNKNIPIISINSGRLGFLSTISEWPIQPSLQKIVSGDYTTSERTLLSVTLSSPDQVKGFDTKQCFALNEVVLSKRAHEMVTIETSLNGKLLTSYWADGLMVATPTGSTAYSLGCGGPIVSPENKVVTIVPIAPHNLNARPLVIPDSSELKFKVTNRASNFTLALDSRMFVVNNDVSITITKASFPIKFISPTGSHDFYDKISERLLWGEDKRN